MKETYQNRPTISGNVQVQYNKEKEAVALALRLLTSISLKVTVFVAVESVKGSGNSAFLQKDQLCYLKRAEN